MAIEVGVLFSFRLSETRNAFRKRKIHVRSCITWALAFFEGDCPGVDGALAFCLPRERENFSCRGGSGGGGKHHQLLNITLRRRDLDTKTCNLK